MGTLGARLFRLGGPKASGEGGPVILDEDIGGPFQDGGGKEMGACFFLSETERCWFSPNFILRSPSLSLLSL